MPPPSSSPSVPGTWCPACARPLPGDAMFCDGCGVSLAAPFANLGIAGAAPESRPGWPTPELMNPLDDTKLPYATFLQRFTAHLIDQAAILAAAWFVGKPLGSMVYGSFYALRPPIAAELASYIGALLVAAFTSFVFEVLWVGSQLQATPGKRVMRLKVTNLRGKPIRVGHAFGRYTLKGLSGSVFCIGFLIQPYTEKKQALHDMLGRTLVLQR